MSFSCFKNSFFSFPFSFLFYFLVYFLNENICETLFIFSLEKKTTKKALLQLVLGRASGEYVPKKMQKGNSTSDRPAFGHDPLRF